MTNMPGIRGRGDRIRSESPVHLVSPSRGADRSSGQVAFGQGPGYQRASKGIHTVMSGLGANLPLVDLAALIVLCGVPGVCCPLLFARGIVLSRAVCMPVAFGGKFRNAGRGIIRAGLRRC